MTVAERPGEEPGPGSQSSLRQANAGRILEALRLEGAMTQADLARRTALAPSTVSGIVHELEEAHLVRLEATHGGRRGRLVDLAVEGRVVAGLDVGHAHLRVGLAGLDRDLLGTRYERITPDRHTHAHVLARARELLDELLAEHGLSDENVVAVGLSLPAPIDLGEGRIVGARPVLPGWAGVDLAATATAALGRPVTVDNDANIAVMAEQRWGAGAGLANVVYIKIGHGVGAGLVINGELFRGATGVSGEIGHTIIDERGTFCRCGNRGCLETVINASHLLDLIHPARPDIETIPQLIDAALAGDPACTRLLGDAARAAGVAAANLCNLLNPDMLVIGGALAAAGPLLIDPLREAVERFGVPSAVSRLQIRAAEFGADTHLLGAIALALDAVAAPAAPRGAS